MTLALSGGARRVVCVCAVAVLSTIAPAQGENPGARSFARIDVAAVKLRCFPTEISPAYSESLSEGDVVVVGDLQDGFREVRLPLGVRGYVHKRYASADDEGTVTADAEKLAFRYRGQPGEAPVCFVERGTTFHLVDETDDWWIVRYPARTAWVADGDLVVFAEDAEVPTLEAGYADLEGRQRVAIEATVARRHAVREAAEADLRRRTAFGALADTFQAELSKAHAAQSYDALLAEIDVFAKTIDADDQLAASTAALRDRVERQVASLQAREIFDTEPVPATIDVPKPKVIDPLRHFTAVGWLIYDDGLFGTRRFRLEKGGQLQFFVTCSTGRYDLRLFDGVEVGLRGERNRPNSDSVRVIDVGRLEVLANPSH